MFLTRRSAIEDKLIGFSEGADDYLAKPFDGRELMARVQALLNRPKRLVDKCIRFSDLEINVAQGTLSTTDSEKRVQLAPLESRLLEFMIRRAETVIPHSMLLDSIWTSEDGAGSVEALAVCINRLRKKLSISRHGGKLIKNIPSRGYGIFAPENKASN